jgi:pilus assembly protein Flp/PilA
MLTFVKQLQMWLQVHGKSDEGATAVEYGLMVALIAGVIVVAVTALGGGLDQLFGDVDAKIPNSVTP